MPESRGTFFIQTTTHCNVVPLAPPWPLALQPLVTTILLSIPMRLPFSYSINEWVHGVRDFLCLDYSIHCTPESTMLSQMTEFLSFYGRMLSHNINRLYCLHLSGDWSPKLTPFLRRLYAYTTYMFEVLTQRRSFYTSRFPRGLCALLCRDNHLNRKSQRPPASGDRPLPHLCFLLTPSIDINFFHPSS